MLRALGVSSRQLSIGLRELPRFLHDYRSFRSRLLESRMPFPMAKCHPCLMDRRDQSGVASGHYFHQDLLVAQRIFQNCPQHHVDVGSRVDGFVAHVAVFRRIEVLDIRGQRSQIPNITFTQADIMSDDFPLQDYSDSISCLHAIEHFGLGRYGDTLDTSGHLRGMTNIYRCLKPGGTLYLSTPIGPQRIEFNAHRVFSLQYLLNWIKPLFTIKTFSLVNDSGDLISPLELSGTNIDTNFGCQFGCGIFELEKKVGSVDH